MRVGQFRDPFASICKMRFRGFALSPFVAQASSFVLMLAVNSQLVEHHARLAAHRADPEETPLDSSPEAEGQSFE